MALKSVLIISETTYLDNDKILHILELLSRLGQYDILDVHDVFMLQQFQQPQLPQGPFCEYFVLKWILYFLYRD